MEIELKYAVSSDRIADRIWSDEELRSMEEHDSRSTEEFRARYFDTEDNVLFRHDIAFRVRQEGERVVASLKWDGTNEGPLHTREELNINLCMRELPEEPDPEVFGESEIGKEMLELIGEDSISPFMEVNVERRAFRVDTGTSIMEVSIDSGEIVTANGSSDVCELEIELYSGDREELEKLGDMIQNRYNLTPEKNSKFARGLMMLDMIDQQEEN